MEHFPPKHWFELARGLCSAEQRSELQAHLDTNCAACQRSFRIWQTIVKLGLQEAHYRPPQEDLEYIKRAFLARSRPIEVPQPFHFARLVFDSLLQPALATVRRTERTGQHLLYEAGPLVIDLYLQADIGRPTSFLTGQILSSGDSGFISESLEVVLLSADRELARLKAGPQGEFEFEITDEPGLSLRVEGIDTEPIYVALPNRKPD